MSVEGCLVRIAPGIGVLVGESCEEESELYKRDLQVWVMNAEEELHDAREKLDRHLAFLKRIHRPIFSPDKE